MKVLKLLRIKISMPNFSRSSIRFSISAQIIGIIFTVPFVYRFGSKPAICVAIAISTVACAIQIASTTLGRLYTGRIILRLANGVITFSNVYTVEAS